MTDEANFYNINFKFTKTAAENGGQTALNTVVKSEQRQCEALTSAAARLLGTPVEKQQRPNEEHEQAYSPLNQEQASCRRI